MTLYYVLGAVIIVVAVIAITVTRVVFRKKSNEIDEKITNLTPYSTKNVIIDREDSLRKDNNSFFVDIETDLERSFANHIVSASEEQAFTAHYTDIFQEVTDLTKRLEAFYMEPSEMVTKFIRDFGSIHALAKRHNEQVIQNILAENKDFFNHCLKYPLDKQQRRSIVSEEDNCLVVSSAGSGKTSSIVGKVRYLIDIKHINPQNILLISYTNKAAAELTERMDIAGLRGYTFHKLAIDIIGKATGQKPSICDNTDALFVKIYHKLLEDEDFKKSIVEYFVDYQVQEADWEHRKNERRQQLSELKEVRLKAQFPDMDGKTIYVRSEQEQKICFVLSSLGVKFRYEEPYEHPLADEMHSQYNPDFSIYFERDGKTKRIYLEHFGVDEHGLVPTWFAKDKGITYEEANQKYNDGITWKKAAHEKFGTVLLTTSSADFHYSDIRHTLKASLEKAGVPVQEKTDAELYDMVLPPNSKQEKAFIRLVVTFVTLIKSSCKSIQEVLKQAKNVGDKRSIFIIKRIFQPVYERYIEELRNNNQIDFTDAILQATEICRSSHPVKYEYIIVDEFQDISVDRYNCSKTYQLTATIS